MISVSGSVLHALLFVGAHVFAFWLVNHLILLFSHYNQQQQQQQQQKQQQQQQQLTHARTHARTHAHTHKK